MALCPFVDYFNHSDHGVSLLQAPKDPCLSRESVMFLLPLGALKSKQTGDMVSKDLDIVKFVTEMARSSRRRGVCIIWQS